jgi:hypothetical protein
MMLAFLVSVAAATTTLEADRAVAATLSLDDASSPVEKVVKLLTDMKATLEEEEKKDEEAYEKFTCWCQNTDGEKTTAIADATNLIANLKAEVERREKKAEKLGKKIASSAEEAAQAKDSLDGAEAQRAKDGEKNQDEIVQLTQNVASLKAAIIVLEKHQGPQKEGTKKWQQGVAVADAMLQGKLRLNFLQKVETEPADKLDEWMQTHSFHALSADDAHKIDSTVKHYMQKTAPNGYSKDELALLVKAQGLLTGFLQQKGQYVEGYNNQSGEIFGILNTLKEQLEADLKDAQEREAKQSTEHASLSSSLKEQAAAAAEMETSQGGEAAENTKALADAKEQLADTEKSLAADQAFLKELTATCGKMDEEWLAKKAMRKQEIVAVAEAISMLMDDDARGNMSNTFGFVQRGSSFVQLNLDKKQRAAAAKVLKQAGKKHHDALLVELGSAVQLDAFTKVKKAIDDMIAALKQQQSDEVKHKDFCNAELQKNEMETMATNNQMTDLQSLIDQLEATQDTLTKQLKTCAVELHDMKVSAQRAAEDRIEESQEFQQAVEEQRATRAILAKVKGRLNKFYAAMLQQTPQEDEYRKNNVVVPDGASPGEYKKNAGAGGVLGMLDSLITDAMKLEVEAIQQENDAVAGYTSFTHENNAAMGAKEEEIVNKSELKAQAEKDHEQAQSDLQAALEELDGLHKYNGDLHKQCDFVLNNFDARQTARGEEITALQQAKGILSGSSESF